MKKGSATGIKNLVKKEMNVDYAVFWRTKWS